MANELLKNILEYAGEHVTFYQNIKGNSPIGDSEEYFRKLPPVYKKDLLEKAEDHVSDEYKKFPQNQYLELRRTSGSTGHYLKILWDVRDNIKSLLPLWRLRYSYYGISPEDKFVSFYSTSYVGNKLVENQEETYHYRGRNLSFCKENLSKERIQHIIERIKEFDPVWFNLQPSMAKLLADAYEKNRQALPASLRYIELNGEVLSKQLKEYLETVFGVPIANQYGCNEANSLALECPHGRLHCLWDNAMTEVYKDGRSVFDEEGDVYITCFTNRAMPFIKYALGDRAVITKGGDCPCGNTSPIIKVIQGRGNHYILKKNGDRINFYTLSQVIETVNEKMNHIIQQFQIIQKDYEELQIRLVIKRSFIGWQSEIEKMFKKSIQEKELKEYRFVFEFPEEIYPDENTGKLNSFVQCIKEEAQ